MAVVAIVAIGLSPAVTSRYGWMDDLAKLVSALGDGSSIDHVVGDGRPIAAAIQNVAYELAGSIAGLAWLRLVTILVIATIAIVVRRLLLAAGMAAWTAGAVAAVTCLQIPFAVAAGFVACMTQMLAALLGLGCGILLTSLDADASTRAAIRRVVIATTVYVTAWLTYQPSTMFVWVSLAISLAFTHPVAGRLGRLAWMHATTFVIGSVVGSGLALAAIAFRGSDAGSRSALIAPADVPERVVWFVTRYVVVAARPFQSGSPSGIEAVLTAGPVLAIIAVGLVLHARRGPVPALHLALLAAIVPLSVAPILITIEQQLEYRLLGALTLVIVLYAAAAARVLASISRLHMPAVASAVLAALLLGGSAVGASHDLHHSVIDSSVTVDRHVRRELAEYPVASAPDVAIVMPEAPFDPETWGVREEVGDHSITIHVMYSYVPANLVRLVLRDRGAPVDQIEVEVVPEGEVVPSGAFMVDLRPLVGLSAS